MTTNKEIFDRIKLIKNSILPFTLTTDTWIPKFLENLTPDSTTKREKTLDNNILNEELLISKKEIKFGIHKLKKKKAGYDLITNEILKNLDQDNVNYLLKAYNQILTTGSIPTTWKKIIIFPKIKPQKDPLNHLSYRPIGNISVARKLFEIIIKHKLEWFLKKTH